MGVVRASGKWPLARRPQLVYRHQMKIKSAYIQTKSRASNAVARLKKFRSRSPTNELKPGEALAPWRFDISKKSNALWGRSDGGKRVTTPKKSLIRPETKIFTMGSCFALEIRDALSASGFDTYPKWDSVEYDPERQRPGPPGKGRHPAYGLAHYDTFAMLQELKRAVNRGRWTGRDMWQLP